MMDASKMTLLCMDYGQQTKFAQAMALKFETVYYWNPNIHDGFQDVRDVEIGKGLTNVIKITEWTTVIPEVDLIAFTDCYEPGLQQYFRDQGIPVFGSGHSSLLETDRVYLKNVLETLGLPIGPYEIVNGIDYLEYVLREKEEVYIKNNHRQNFETTKWKNWRLSKGELKRMRNEVGIFGNKETYIVEDKLEGIIECGIDTFVVDGAYPDVVSTGIEIKDTGYLNCLMNYNELPKQVKEVTDKLAPIFSDLGYRGFHSNEIIIGTDMLGYLIDATCRLGQPPNDLLVNLISNYDECLVQVANGIVPLIKSDYKYGCQLILKSEMAKQDDTPIMVPDQYKQFVSVKNLFIDPEGTWYYARRGLAMCEIGSVCGVGNTLKQAIEMATEIANSIEAEDAHVELACIDKGMESLKKLSKAGIKYFM
jgi:phosphoribosylamine-glycine ligase